MNQRNSDLLERTCNSALDIFLFLCYTYIQMKTGKTENKL